MIDLSASAETGQTGGASPSSPGSGSSNAGAASESFAEVLAGRADHGDGAAADDGLPSTERQGAGSVTDSGTSAAGPPGDTPSEVDVGGMSASSDLSHLTKQADSQAGLKVLLSSLVGDSVDPDVAGEPSAASATKSAFHVESEQAGPSGAESPQTFAGGASPSVASAPGSVGDLANGASVTGGTSDVVPGAHVFADAASVGKEQEALPGGNSLSQPGTPAEMPSAAEQANAEQSARARAIATGSTGADTPTAESQPASSKIVQPGDPSDAKPGTPSPSATNVVDPSSLDGQEGEDPATSARDTAEAVTARLAARRDGAPADAESAGRATAHHRLDGQTASSGAIASGTRSTTAPSTATPHTTHAPPTTAGVPPSSATASGASIAGGQPALEHPSTPVFAAEPTVPETDPRSALPLPNRYGASKDLAENGLLPMTPAVLAQADRLGIVTPETMRPDAKRLEAIVRMLESDTGGGRVMHAATTQPVEATTDWVAVAPRTPSVSSTVLTDLEQAELPDQLIKAIRLQWRDGIGEARLRLHPQHLGEVSVALQVRQGAVSAVLSADSDAVREWIRSHQSELKAALAAQGLLLEELVVEEDRQSRQHSREPTEYELRRSARRPTEDVRFEVRV